MSMLYQKCGVAVSKMREFVPAVLDSFFEMRNCKPSVLSVIWMLICVRLCFAVSYAQTTWMEYLIWGTVGVMTLQRLSKQKKLFPYEVKTLFFCFGILFGLMVVGLVFHFTAFAVKSIITCLCVYCFIAELLAKKPQVQLCYIRTGYYLVLTTLLIYTVSSVNLGNTVPACIVFLTCGYAVLEYQADSEGRFVLRSKKSNRFWLVAVDLFLAFAISWESHARTASLVVLIIVAFFLLYSVINKKHIQHLFWVFTAGSLLLCIAYAYITYAPFYDALNAVSNKLFNKNIDSDRGGLWCTSLSELSWWQYIVGKGTGTLPSMDRFSASSFHNTYLQLLMQNGILGLGCLYAVFYFFWKKLSKHADDRVIQFVLAVFVGFMVYNCFETTLLQNKTFLGIIQWLILVLGLIRCQLLNKKKG